MTTKKSKRVAFTLDERSLVKLENMTEPGHFSSMLDAFPFPDPRDERIRVLEEALRPFAAAYQKYMEYTSGNGGDIRAYLPFDPAVYKAAADALGEQ